MKKYCMLWPDCTCGHSWRRWDRISQEGWEPDQFRLDCAEIDIRNFLDCVTSRKAPVLNLELAHHVSTVAHLGNIAFRTGHKLVWDSTKERIANDSVADKLVGVKYRKPWKLPYANRA